MSTIADDDYVHIIVDINTTAWICNVLHALDAICVNEVDLMLLG